MIKDFSKFIDELADFQVKYFTNLSKSPTAIVVYGLLLIYNIYTLGIHGILATAVVAILSSLINFVYSRVG